MKAISAGLDRLYKVFMMIGVLLLAAEISFITADVLLRNILGRGLPGSIDLTEYALYLQTMLMAPYLLHRGQHIRVDVLVQSLPTALARILDLVADIIGAAATAALTWYGIANLLRSYADGAMMWKSIVIPEWWLLLPMPICICLMFVEFLFRIARTLAGSEPQNVTAAGGGL